MSVEIGTCSTTEQREALRARSPQIAVGTPQHADLGAQFGLGLPPSRHLNVQRDNKAG